MSAHPDLTADLDAAPALLKRRVGPDLAPLEWSA
jgi:hypothetical protein